MHRSVTTIGPGEIVGPSRHACGSGAAEANPAEDAIRSAQLAPMAHHDFPWPFLKQGHVKIVSASWRMEQQDLGWEPSAYTRRGGLIRILSLLDYLHRRAVPCAATPRGRASPALTEDCLHGLALLCATLTSSQPVYQTGSPSSESAIFDPAGLDLQSFLR